ncbi:MAG: YXWGXW repeat-containing protein [Dysgonamonadaceae bacterium]|jgi:hypothetical protein|nr:YXWGXW repeat-containing protein [Dysgonamonadaceae bacterium]
MKAKSFATFFTSMLFVLVFEVSAQVHVHFSVYTRIPLAPDIVLNVSAERIAPPAPHYVWIDGYWAWDAPRRTYVWIDGHWAYPPYDGAYWIPGYWEKVNRGYAWINAGWAPRNYRMHFGYYAGRYDYYGRPVYYHKPDHYHHHHVYVYSYDHRPDYRGRGHSSSAYYNSHTHDKKYKDNDRTHYTTGNRNNAGGRDKIYNRERKEVSERGRVSGPTKENKVAVNNHSSERKETNSNGNKNRTRVSPDNDGKQNRKSSQSVSGNRQEMKPESSSDNVKSSRNESSRERRNTR